MRTILTTTTLFFFLLQCPFAQNHIVGADYDEYYDWFHQHSQVDQLYTDGSTLYTFNANTMVQDAPCRQSEVLTKLPLAYPVKNIAYTEAYLPEDELNGYGDIWYQVKGQSPDGKSFTGYIWGGDIAKAWRKANLYSGSKTDFVILGVSTQARKTFSDIKAEVKIVRGHKMLLQTTVPGLCIFEDCASSPLLRVLNHPDLKDVKIIEASTMTIGCFAGIEKTFFYWNGNSLELVLHHEITTGTTFAKNTFVVNQPASDGHKVMLCSYSHEDKNYSPVWNCQEIDAKHGMEDKATAAR